MSLMGYQVAGEAVSSTVAFLERALERFARTGAVVAEEHVKPTAPRVAARRRPTKRRRWHKHRPMDRGTKRAIAAAYLGPERLIDIANRFNCSPCQVRIAAVECGCPVRSAGRRGGVA